MQSLGLGDDARWLLAAGHTNANVPMQTQLGHDQARHDHFEQIVGEFRAPALFLACLVFGQRRDGISHASR